MAPPLIASNYSNDANSFISFPEGTKRYSVLIKIESMEDVHELFSVELEYLDRVTVRFYILCGSPRILDKYLKEASQYINSLLNLFIK
jgi:hypothetical protein